jgi:hypothetical protein
MTEHPLQGAIPDGVTVFGNRCLDPVAEAQRIANARILEGFPMGEAPDKDAGPWTMAEASVLHIWGEGVRALLVSALLRACFECRKHGETQKRIIHQIILFNIRRGWLPAETRMHYVTEDGDTVISVQHPKLKRWVQVMVPMADITQTEKEPR